MRTQSQRSAIGVRSRRASRRSRGLAGELDLGAGERDRGRDESRPVDGRGDVEVARADDRRRGRRRWTVERRAVDPEAARGVALGIEVDDEDAITGEGQIGCEIDHRGGLPDAALLIGAGDRLAHSGPPLGTHSRTSNSTIAAPFDPARRGPPGASASRTHRAAYRAPQACFT